MEIIDVLKQIAESSSRLSSISLAIFGGSVAVILGTSYRRPEHLAWRLLFLLFIPGWIFLGMSVYLGGIIEGRYLAAIIGSASKHGAIASLVNDDYGRQRQFLLYSLVCFSAWLVFYLLYWVFCEEKKR